MRRVAVILCWLTVASLATADDPRPVLLWDTSVPFPQAREAPYVKGARFHVIHNRDPAGDGYNWLHGVAVVQHGGKLFASWGHNRGKENTITEEARASRSEDGGRSWSSVETIGSHTDGEGRSHGVFLSHEGQLWTFVGRFGPRYSGLKTEAFVLDETAHRWVSQGIVASGCWPCEEPLRMDDGNWITGCLTVGDGNPPAVAISRGDDFTHWEKIAIPVAADVGNLWGEATVIVNGSNVLLISRYGARAVALAAASADGGRSWTPLRVSNLPMTTSKPYAGVLSTGQWYLVGTTTADSGKRRSPLTIAVGRPGAKQFCKVYRIRDAVQAVAGESHPEARLSYPYAIEIDGHLYVGYSNDGGRGSNRNSGELAVLPVASLAAD